MSRSNRGAEARLHRKRYSERMSRAQLVAAVCAEVMTVCDGGRVPWDVAEDALEMALDEIRDRIAEQSPSWALGVRWSDSDRARMPE